MPQLLGGAGGAMDLPIGFLQGPLDQPLLPVRRLPLQGHVVGRVGVGGNQLRSSHRVSGSSAAGFMQSRSVRGSLRWNPGRFRGSERPMGCLRREAQPSSEEGIADKRTGGGDRYDALAAAMSRALGRMSRDIGDGALSVCEKVQTGG